MGVTGPAHRCNKRPRPAGRRERRGDAVPPGLIRLSAGREDTDDLLDDVLGAPERIRA
ncbi:MAG: hypothetical protein JWP64_5226 [Pseudonocardia sp.]|uniref:hypothetical protein n=1 Tax=Pseudonocardia sp. TaxID=60912 RepID=UPI00261248AE|nr:hypothetical protein [Pseudonocardia sp.]MCU1630277.1 hypothetical protein [Pseudonocardia sp.]